MALVLIFRKYLNVFVLLLIEFPLLALIERRLM
jgi:hypothetical protein